MRLRILWVALTAAVAAWALVDAQVSQGPISGGGSGDLSAYVPITKAGQQTITATGAGMDVTLAATDDVILSPTDDLSFTATGDQVYFASATSTTLTAATSQLLLDINELSVDLAGDNASLDFNAGSGAGSFWQMYCDGTPCTGTLAAKTIVLDAASGTDELSLAAGVFKVGVPLAIPALATLPACNTTIAPTGFYALHYDTTGPDLCTCNGTAWSTVDGSGTCA